MTPDNITELQPYQIFVFGSNLEGDHAAGAAKLALEKFGAIQGKGVGQQGACYAIPTMGGLQQIEMYAADFLTWARINRHLEFLLTKVGCGIAGHTEAEIAPFFKHTPSNVIKPKGWK